MKVIVKGSNTTVDLTQRDYLSAGGEGAVYVKQSTAYKIYHDPSKMIPLGKFQELSTIKDPNVIRPQDFLIDKAGTVVGYTMRFIDNSYPLCQIFPRSFREREGITQAQVLDLVTKLQTSIANIHANNILIVDANEMNFLVSKDFKDTYAIDADSYQTKSYKATALMESIRDWSVTGHQWTPLSDWYSFAILSFQMFVGVHPFRGKYHGGQVEFKTKLPTDSPDDAFAITRRRMQANVSVLDSKVGVPSSAYPLTAIPKEYLRWYEALFIHGMRLPPPGKAGMTGVVMVAVQSVTGTDTTIDFTVLHTMQEPITGFWDKVITTGTKTYLSGALVPVPHSTQVTAVAFTPRADRTVVGSLQGNQLLLYNMTDRATIAFDYAVSEIASYDGRMYARAQDFIYEVVFTDAGSQVIATAKSITQIMPHATRLYSGVAIQSMLGSVFISMFLSAGSALQVRVKELDKYRILDAKFDHGVLMVVGVFRGVYERLVFRFDGDTYDCRAIPSDSGYSLNFVTLDSGVSICLNEDGKLEVISNKKDSSSIKIIEDKALSGNARLAKVGGTLVIIDGNVVFKLRMK